eukprot:366319-Chlamydomonas_euryale.AAC.13
MHTKYGTLALGFSVEWEWAGHPGAVWSGNGRGIQVQCGVGMGGASRCSVEWEWVKHPGAVWSGNGRGIQVQCGVGMGGASKGNMGTHSQKASCSQA